MDEGNTILGLIRQSIPEYKILPESFIPTAPKLVGVQLLDQFTRSIKMVGSEIFHFEGKEKMLEYIQENFKGSVNLLSAEVKTKYAYNTSNSELGKTNLVILEGQLGVAENGAIWVDETNFLNRLLPFVPQQLVLVLDKTLLVSTMHEAYQRIELTETGFGVFISGPSKTADIEQSLVYGAHGARELRILIY